MEEKIKQEEIFSATASIMPVNLTDPTAIIGLSNAIIPADRIMRIKKAKKYRDIDLVNRLLQMRRDYAINIKGISCKNKRQKKFYEENVLPLVVKLAREFTYEFHSVGDTFIHYGFKQDDKTPLFLKLEDSENVEPYEALGLQKFKVVVSAEFKRQLKEIAKDKTIRLPQYIRDIIDDNGRTLKIGNNLVLDGENMYRISNLRQSYETYPLPPLLRIAKAIELRELLMECDFSEAMSLKNSIVHTRVGLKDKPAGKEKVQSTHEMITSQPSGTMFLTTGSDVEIAKIKTVDANTWNPQKYIEANQRILQFFGISLTLIPSVEGGSSYSSGVISIKPFQQALKTDRKIFDEFIAHFFRLINEKNGFRETVTLDYERDNLYDVKERIAELTFLIDKGAMGFEDLCLEFDYDRDDQVEKRKWDWENREIIAPVYELSQGLAPTLESKMKQQTRLKEMGTTNNQMQDKQKNTDGQV